MDVVTKKPSLLKSSLLIALALNLTALPAINATADMINQTPSESIPNFDPLTAEQSDIESIRHQVEQTLSSMPLNTERLKQAASYFKAKDDDKARAVLDSATIAQEQNLLLAQLAKQPELQAQLDDKATELILLAMLTAIDAKLGDQRMAKANQYFEQALKSGRSAGYLYQYALFADNTNQTEHADKLFTEALAAQRKLANDEPENLTFMITLLDRLGTVKLNLSQYDAGYALYTEALALSLKLITLEPKASSTLSTTLNSMWVITRADPKRSNDIVKLYEQTIATLRTLSVSAPEANLATLA
ncbi:MAG TPA: hypothetical protein PLM98_17315, partial [Thiolinea sp.]|nr:hypothetical protein [Thiolinea sp.]